MISHPCAAQVRRRRKNSTRPSRRPPGSEGSEPFLSVCWRELCAALSADSRWRFARVGGDRDRRRDGWASLPRRGETPRVPRPDSDDRRAPRMGAATGRPTRQRRRLRRSIDRRELVSGSAGERDHAMDVESPRGRSSYEADTPPGLPRRRRPCPSTRAWKMRRSTAPTSLSRPTA